jgi:hypothetical protein
MRKLNRDAGKNQFEKLLKASQNRSFREHNKKKI